MPSTLQAIHAYGRSWRGSGSRMSGCSRTSTRTPLCGCRSVGKAQQPSSWIWEQSKVQLSPRSCSICLSTLSFDCWTPPASPTRSGTPQNGTIKPSQTTSHCTRRTQPTQIHYSGWCSSSKIGVDLRSRPRSHLQRELAERPEEAEQ